MRQRIWLAGAGIIALILALLTVRFVQTRVEHTVVWTTLPVAKADIPAYTLITEDMLTEAEFPQQVATTKVARTLKDLVGKVARTDIPAGAPVFLAHVQDLAAFHLSERARTALVPLDVKSEVALGVTPGQKIDVWRVALGRQINAENAAVALAHAGAAAELVAHDLPVLAVYGPRGTKAANRSSTKSRLPAAPSPTEGEGTLRAVLVEADPVTAAKLVRLMGEVQTGMYRMYLTLSPVVRDKETLQAMRRAANPTTPTPTATPTATVSSLPVDGTTPTPTPTPTRYPITDTPTPTPTRPPTAHVLPGPASGLNVRSGPGTAFPVLVQVRAGTRLTLLGRTEDASWLYVDTGEVQGWVAAPYVRVAGNILDLPVRAP